MHKLKSMAAAAILALSASGCSATSDARAALNVAAATTGGPAAGRAEIARKLSAICPTPTQWTSAQRRLVGAYMIERADDPAMRLLAPEWERLDDGARACRGAR